MSDIRIKMAKDLRDMSDMVGDLHWMAAKAVDDLTKKDGEIAKRDARIAEMQERFDSSAHRTSLIGRLEIENDQLRAELSAIKAQGVVMPERWNVPRPTWKDARQPYGNPLNHADIEAAEKFNLALDEVARLNATHVQQVSVQSVCQECNGEGTDRSSYVPLKHRDLDDCKACGGTGRLNAAPASPAADAGIVDMYRHLQTVTPYRFKKIQDASITDGGDVMYFHKDRFDAALLADMAAHCAAKGVV